MSKVEGGMREHKFCVACGEKLDFLAETCPKCGVRQPRFPGAQVQGGISRRIAAALFAILLGTFGVHKFYLGKIGMGILYLLFFWTVIPTIVGVIEGIIYLTKSDDAFEEQYRKLRPV
jgi:TM2 domain-containing membrane protein YozV/ribosomal protein L40E